ncbi:universal stress protein [Nocardioides sp.]|uniref:universal stress protein n=1 Tax=Nocardioides sp. TaxID=35761 RepID=UPI0025D7CC34|nr:universal stress protein [Nocardioides sp.]
MSDNEFRVLVAVGPDGVRDGTLDFAAAEALQRGTGVELVHVVHSLVVVPSRTDQVQALDTALLRVGRTVLTDAAERMRTRVDGAVPLRTEILSGPVPATIADRAAGRDLVVLERRDPDVVDRLLTMSVSTRVAAHAKAPVVVVPHGWAPAAGPLPVTVGVDHPIEAAGQVETAAAYAVASGRELRVLYAMWLAEPYQDTFFVNHTREQWTAEADVELQQALEKMGDLGTTVTRVVRWVRPVDALVDATRRSAVVVLSRRPDHGPHGTHLGPVTRAVLRHAACPVLVVDRT